MTRCSWAKAEPNLTYHDREWGVPVHDDRLLFEFLILEGAQAGLSWTTILNKRDNYRKAFDNFDARKVAKYNSLKIKKLLADAGIGEKFFDFQRVVFGDFARIEIVEGFAVVVALVQDRRPTQPRLRAFENQKFEK